MEYNEAKILLENYGYNIIKEAEDNTIWDNIRNRYGKKFPAEYSTETYKKIVQALFMPKSLTADTVEDLADRYGYDVIYNIIKSFSNGLPTNIVSKEICGYTTPSTVKNHIQKAINAIKEINNRTQKEHEEQFINSEIEKYEQRAELIPDIIDFIKEIGGEIKNLKYKTLREILTSDRVARHGIMMSNDYESNIKNRFKEDGFKTIPVEQFLKYIDEDDKLMDAKVEATADLTFDNGIDIFRPELQSNIISIGNDEPLERIKKFIECPNIEYYLNWRAEHRNTWYIPANIALKAIKEYMEALETMTKDEIEKYKKNVEAHNKINREISDYYSSKGSGGYTGD